MLAVINQHARRSKRQQIQKSVKYFIISRVKTWTHRNRINFRCASARYPSSYLIKRQKINRHRQNLFRVVTQAQPSCPLRYYTCVVIAKRQCVICDSIWFCIRASLRFTLECEICELHMRAWYTCIPLGCNTPLWLYLKSLILRFRVREHSTLHNE